MDQDESNCAMWKSENLLFCKLSVLRRHQNMENMYTSLKDIKGSVFRYKRFCDQLNLAESDLLLFKAHQQQKQRAENGAIVPRKWSYSS